MPPVVVVAQSDVARDAQDIVQSIAQNIVTQVGVIR